MTASEFFYANRSLDDIVFYQDSPDTTDSAVLTDAAIKLMEDYHKAKMKETQGKITRLEVINHAKNDKPVGRILTMYKELKNFNSVEMQFQDGGKTLKIFLS